LEINKKSVLVIGDVMVDKWVYLEKVKLSPEANVPVVRENSAFAQLGGAANAVRHLENLSGSSHELLGLIGDDKAGVTLLDLSLEIDSKVQLITEAARKSTQKIRYFLDESQIFRKDIEDTFEISSETEQNFKKLIAESIDRHDVVLLSDYAKGVVSKNIVSFVIEQCQKVNTPVISDPGFGRLGLFAGCDVIKPNKIEWEYFVTQIGNESDAIEHLIAKGTKFIFVTQGVNGIRLIGRDLDMTKPIEKTVKQVDVTGAGDSVAAAISLLYQTENDLDKLLVKLNQVGASTVSQIRTELPIFDFNSERSNQ
jgi:D-beta-D-heptose 7-phosphate kinase/D-beta-D-heptose 1-phosphate adenosyltransferase